MKPMDEIERIMELLPGYSLGLLEPDEQAEVERYLDGCRICTEEIHLYDGLAGILLSTATEVDPPVQLRARLQERINKSTPAAARPVSRATPPGFIARLRAAWARPVIQAVLSVLLVVLVGSNIFLWQSRSEDQASAHIPGGMSALPLLGTENAPEATGFALISEDGASGMLVAEHLPTLPADMVYQVWLAIDEEGVLDSGGLFEVDELGYGGLRLKTPLALKDYNRLGVTMEPAAGSSGPTGVKVLGGDFE